MAYLIIADDFKEGTFELPQTKFNPVKMQEIINEVENEMLIKLLGFDLYTLFVADVDSMTKKPVTAKYLTLYDQIATVDFYGDTIFNKGMKHALKCFIYFEYCKRNNIKVTPVANTTAKTENSNNALNSNEIAGIYNDGIDGFIVVQKYINDNSSDYPDYKFTKLKYEYFL